MKPKNHLVFNKKEFDRKWQERVKENDKEMQMLIKELKELAKK